MVQSLKDFSRLDRAAEDRFNVVDGLQKVLVITKNLWKYGVEVKRNFEDVPDIFCSPSRLNQVFINLITNAVQAMDGKGKLVIATSARGDWVEVTVQDTGCGIPTENLTRVMDPFFPFKPVGKGTGLGLSMVRQVVEEHEGQLLVDSVLLASAGDDATKILANRNVHVVVSDQSMPEMAGVELLSRVKQAYPSCMRILLAVYADLDAVEASINESEVFRYLMKPCPSQELKDAVRLAVQAVRVSEMAGVPELAAVPRAELEMIELMGVVDQGAGECLESVDEAVDSSAGEIADALQILSEYPHGVLITDTAVNQLEIDHLAHTLKQAVPELVTIVAGERSDAALLIGLINHGQIFRFLLKPLQIAQTRIWLNSAMIRHAELCSSSNQKLRYTVAPKAAVEATSSGFFNGAHEGIKALTNRLASSLMAGLRSD